MNPFDIQTTLKRIHAPEFRIKQLIDAIHHGAISWSKLSSWPVELRSKVQDAHPFVTWKHAEVKISEDGTKKAILTLVDNQIIETVLMESKPGVLSVCLSCEVGCPMNCSFCATGNMGFRRALTSEEITDQYLFWLNYILRPNTSHSTLRTIKSVVYMGMGEPFHNWEQVKNSIHVIQKWYGIGYRHISISTCGIPEGIEQLAQTYPQVNLAISLHAADDETRSTLMPINKNVDLNTLKKALVSYQNQTNRQIMFEYLLISAINDTQRSLDSLITFIRQLKPNLTHVNLIRYNQTDTQYRAPTKNHVRWFRDQLVTAGISVSIRKNLGEDIHGACGQLASSIKSVL